MNIEERRIARLAMTMRILGFRWSMLIAVLAFSILPSLALGSGAIGYKLATIPAGIPGADAIDYLSGRGMATWFLAMAAIAIASWTWIAKWLISQLEKQRDTNAALTGKLLGYMESDHAAMVEVLTKVSDSQKETAATLRLVLDRIKS